MSDFIRAVIRVGVIVFATAGLFFSGLGAITIAEGSTQLGYTLVILAHIDYAICLLLSIAGEQRRQRSREAGRDER